MKTRFLFIAFTVFLTLLLTSCDSGSSSNSRDADNVSALDLNADSLAFDLGTDTLFVSWITADSLRLNVTGLENRPDSMEVNYKVSGSNSWKNLGSLSLENLPVHIGIHFGDSATVDFQLILIFKDGSRVVADSAYEALTERFFEKQSSSEDTSLLLTQFKILKDNFCVVIVPDLEPVGNMMPAGRWTGAFPNEDGSYELELKINKDKENEFREIFIEDSDSVCIEYTGTWAQVEAGSIAVRRLSKLTHVKREGVCATLNGRLLSKTAGSIPDDRIMVTLIDTTLAYFVKTLDSQASRISLGIPDFGSMTLLSVED